MASRQIKASMSPSFMFTLVEITVVLCHTLAPCWCLAIVYVFCVALFAFAHVRRLTLKQKAICVVN